MNPKSAQNLKEEDVSSLLLFLKTNDLKLIWDVSLPASNIYKKMLRKRILSTPNPLHEPIGDATVGKGVFDVVYPDIVPNEDLDKQRQPQ